MLKFFSLFLLINSLIIIFAQDEEQISEPGNKWDDINKNKKFGCDRWMNPIKSSGKTVKYFFNISYISGWPDGVYKETILAINDEFPGPEIRANINDILEVHVTNWIQNKQGTTIHWHGLHQRGTVFADGVSYITQCPIKYGRTQIYRFPLHQSGTYWYHAHVRSQYAEGLWGSLIINNDEEYYGEEYECELTLTLNDWYHKDISVLEDWHLSPESNGVPPYPDTGMINGLGRYNCTVLENLEDNPHECNATSQMRHVFSTPHGKTCRIRVINTSAYASFEFSIDNHKLTTIEVDSVDVVKPGVQTDIAILAASQRYSFLVKMDNDKDGQYLIRASLLDNILIWSSRVPNINLHSREALITNITAILKYHVDDSTEVYSETEPHDFNEIIIPLDKTDLEYLNESLLLPYPEEEAPVFDIEDEYEIVLYSTFMVDSENVRRASFNRMPLKHPDKVPLLFSAINGEALSTESYPHYILYGKVVQVVINNDFYGPHPFHLHGHYFWILGKGETDEGNYNGDYNILNTKAVKRDTLMVEHQSWAVIRFVADNPGIWNFHCHVDWHLLSGMAITFITDLECLRNITIPESELKVCSG